MPSQITVVKLDSIAQAPGRRSEAGLGSAHSAAHIMDPQRLQHTPVLQLGPNQPAKLSEVTQAWDQTQALGVAP